MRGIIQYQLCPVKTYYFVVEEIKKLDAMEQFVTRSLDVLSEIRTHQSGKFAAIIAWTDK